MPNPELYQTRHEGQRFRVRFRQDGRHRSKTFATPPEAQHFCDMIASFGVERAVRELDYDRNAQQEPTLDEWAVVHFDALTRPAATTVARYRRIYRQWWQPTLGHMRLSTIERTDVAKALNQVTGSDKTILNAWGVLTHMLKLAAQDGKIPRSPTIGVSPPRRRDHEREEHRYLNVSEFEQILAATPEHWRPLVWMLGGTGMRWGELAALTVGDVELDMVVLDDAGHQVIQHVVRITKAEVQNPDQSSNTVIGPTKTGKSRRTVTLPNEVVTAVRPLLEGRKRTDRLFLPPKGGPLRHRTFYRDIWLKKCCANSGIREPFPRLHDLRHSHVAWLIARGVQMPVIQARLGHEKITTSIDTYGHLLPDLQRAAADAASQVFGSRAPVGALGAAEMPDDAAD